MARRRQGAVPRVDVADDVIGDVVLVPPGRRGVDELAAAVPGGTVDEHEDARRRCVGRGVERVEALEDGWIEEMVVAPLLHRRAVSGEHVDDGQAGVAALVSGRQPHVQAAPPRIAQRIVAEGLALDHVVDQAPPAARRGGHGGHCP